MPHRHVYAYRDWSTQSYHLLEGLTESYHRILPICSLRTGREQHVPDSTNQSLFHENEGHFGGNQFLYGSIRPSPPCRRRTICPSISKRAFARDSPDFVFSSIFQGFSARYSYSNHSQDHGQWQVCMCACVFVVVYCACGCCLYTSAQCSKYFCRNCQRTKKKNAQNGQPKQAENIVHKS